MADLPSEGCFRAGGEEGEGGRKEGKDASLVPDIWPSQMEDRQVTYVGLARASSKKWRLPALKFPSLLIPVGPLPLAWTLVFVKNAG